MHSTNRFKIAPTGYVFLAVLFLIAGCAVPELHQEPLKLRVATFNVEDVRTDDLQHPDHPRLERIASILQELQPDVVLVNEIAYDYEGVPGYDPAVGEGKNAERLASRFLSVSQSPDLQSLHYESVMMPSNTGVHSGFDLDNDGIILESWPEVPSAEEDGTPGMQTDEGRAYGNDGYGFGMFPGQYAMALFVSDSLEILRDQIRTFQLFKWSDMPGALRPVDPSTGTSWYDDSEWAALRLSSKTHMDVPIRLPNGAVVHILCSHPTPPAFDGEEKRNQLRNHDEIRLWADYINGAGYIVDDEGNAGGLAGSSFVLLGDQNADPDEGSSFGDPIGSLLFSLPAVNHSYVPVSDQYAERLDPDDTAQWGLRIDYVLPSTDLKVSDGGVYRYEGRAVSDHFPIWVDLLVPSP